MTVPEGSNGRPGTSMDLARRMDRMESAHEALAKEVSGLTTTIARVESNQHHAEELNKLRFDAMAESQAQMKMKLDVFIDRIDKMISGETQTPQSRAGAELVADYKAWREEVDRDREELNRGWTQLKLIGRIVIIVTSGSWVTAVIALTRLLLEYN